MRYRLGLVVLVAACSDATTNRVEQLNLDRPVDIAFACHGGLRLTNGGAPDPTQPIIASAQPIESCNIRSGPRAGTGAPAPQPPGQEDIDTSRVGGAFWYAFILQSGPGTVAIAQFDTKPSASFSGNDVRVLDANPLTPGKNSISVGEDPIAIETDRVGCYAVIANQGSCDLSTLDINSAIEAVQQDVTPIIRRMEVKNASGQPLRARPAAMVFEPAGGVIGAACPATPTGLAYIAYPSCRLVAGVDVSTGTIVTGIQFDDNGTPTVVDGNVSCPAECDGAPITPGVRPVALDLEYDPEHARAVLAIGADNSNVLTIYGLDLQSFHPVALALTSIPLEDPSGRLGITSLEITHVIGMGGEHDMWDAAPGGEHQFVYAVATDGTVRVADLTGAPRECDTQIDPRFLYDERDVNKLSCLPVGDPALPRRAGARGPGIELLDDAIPTSVAVSKIEPIWKDGKVGEPGSRDPDRPIGTPLKLDGTFGLITAANGRTFVFNIDDNDYPDFVKTNIRDALWTPIPLVIPHQLRDSIRDRRLIAEKGNPAYFVCNDPGPNPDAQTGNSGGPRLGGSPVRTIPAGTIAPEKTGALPSIRQVFCDAGGDPIKDPIGSRDLPVPEVYFSAPLEVREEVFPDWRALRGDETWSLTWQGSLSLDRANTAVDGPAVRMSQIFVDGSGMRIADGTRPFCDAGVEPYDIAQLRGCDPAAGNAGCPTGYTCYVHPQSQVVGLGACMLKDEAERLANACGPFLRSLRRYTVGRTKAGELQLLPRKHVLRTTPITGCVDDAQCKTLADYALQTASSLLPGDPALPSDSRTWRCQADPDRRPMDPSTTGKRCLLACDTDNQCAFGTICTAHPDAAPQVGYCMEGVVPPQACVNAPQRYELRAGDAFAVVGSRQGFLHPIIAGAGDACVRDPDANPLLVGRLPLDPPPCDLTVDPRTNRRPDGTYGPNPCKQTVEETEFRLRYRPNTCTLDDPDEEIVMRDATGLRFRNRALNLTIVDPTFSGDLMCHGDRMGSLMDIPIVMHGFQFAFRITAGFEPLRVPAIAPAFPVKVVRGPTESFWIIDEGDFLSTSISQASTRGKVFRVEGRALAIINVLD
jgi:hypothetical protein